MKADFLLHACITFATSIIAFLRTPNSSNEIGSFLAEVEGSSSIVSKSEQLKMWANMAFLYMFQNKTKIGLLGSPRREMQESVNKKSRSSKAEEID